MRLFELHMNVVFPRDLLHLHKVCQGWNNYDLTFHYYFQLFAIVVRKKLCENSTIISIFLNVSCPTTVPMKNQYFLVKNLNLLFLLRIASFVYSLSGLQTNIWISNRKKERSQFVVDFLISIIESALHECRFPRIRNANFCSFRAKMH